MTHQPHLWAYLLLVTATWCWGLNAIISRLAVGEISPMQLVTLRWLGVVLLLLLVARRHIRGDWPVLSRHLPYLCLMGACGFSAFNALFYVAGHHTTAVNIGVLQGSIPVFVLVGNLLFLSQPIRIIQGVGVALTLIGVLTVASNGHVAQLAALHINRGDAFVLIGCALYAAYSVGLSRRPDVSALSLFAVMAAAAWLASLPLVTIETLQQGWTAPSATGWLLAGLVTLLPSFVAQIFFIQGVSLIGSGRAGVFVNLVPVFAAIMAVLFLQEPFEWHHATALALVLGGIGLSELGKSRI